MSHQSIKCKDWVPHTEKAHAKELYAIVVKSNPDLAKALEALVWSADLEKFWKKVSSNPDMVNNNFVTGTLYNELGLLYLRKPNMARAETETAIGDCAKKLKSISSIAKSDSNLSMYLECVFLECLISRFPILQEKVKSGGVEMKGRLSDLLDDFRDRLSDPNKMMTYDTHRKFPQKIREGEMAERVYLQKTVSSIVFAVYKKRNHAETTRILNVIRPDLGHFSADNVRQVTDTRKKTKRSI